MDPARPTSAGAAPRRIALAPRVTRLRRLVGRPVGADWGDPRLLAGLVDPADHDDPRPIAEVWFGAHPRHPSWVVDDGGRTSAALLDAGERPAFLMKLLAAGGPLSIQVHPDAATARRVWEDEESRGVAADAPERRSADPFPKPELVRALTPFRALCGLRPASASRALLTTIAPNGAEPLLDQLSLGDAGLGPTIGALLRADRSTVAAVTSAIVTGAQRLVAVDGAEPGDARPIDPAAVRLSRLAIELADRFPVDPGVLIALLLEDVDLAPGEALFVAPGTPHAYLSGLAVEVMGPSDNVERGGMTTKRINVAGFLEVLDARAVGAPRVGTLPRRVDGTGWRRHIMPSDTFVLDEIELDGSDLVERTGAGASVLLCAEGTVTVAVQGGAMLDLGPGDAALLAAGVDPVRIDGRALVLHASAGRGTEPSS